MCYNVLIKLGPLMEANELIRLCLKIDATPLYSVCLLNVRSGSGL